MQLRPVSPEPAPCKICGAASPLYGVVDFNRSCEEARGKYLPLAGVPVYYRRCPACGLLFSDSFDDWRQEEFQRFIYNDSYRRIDPDYEERRPRANAQMILKMFAAGRSGLRLLDYGGGNGVLAQFLGQSGFLAAQTYDPFAAGHARLPEGSFNLICCFETFEHLPDPLRAVETIVDRLAQPGMVLFSTLVQPADFEKQQMGWWYIGPRNGHISLFSRQSLTLMWQRFGLSVGSFNDNLHAAFRQVPEFARHLIRD